MPTLFEHAGGERALHRLEQVFYDSVLTDPPLQPLFGARQPEHVDHLTAFTAESFGGPDRFSRELGFAHLISVHRGLKITEEQRQRFVELYMRALDAAEMPAEPAFREAVREHVEFGSRVAMQNSHATSDAELHPLREVPRWTWPGDDKARPPMAEIVSGAAYLTFINTFRCDPSNQDEVVQINIDIVDKVASRSDGFVAAAVHRSTDGTRVINYLQWRSAEDLVAMQRSSDFQAIARRFTGLIEFDPHQCEVVHVGQALPNDLG